MKSGVSWPVLGNSMPTFCGARRGLYGGWKEKSEDLIEGRK
jgi:hypothetical protein